MTEFTLQVDNYSRFINTSAILAGCESSIQAEKESCAKKYWADKIKAEILAYELDSARETIMKQKMVETNTALENVSINDLIIQ